MTRGQEGVTIRENRIICNFILETICTISFTPGKPFLRGDFRHTYPKLFISIDRDIHSIFDFVPRFDDYFRKCRIKYGVLITSKLKSISNYGATSRITNWKLEFDQSDNFDFDSDSF